jgi:hypothetical protein
MSEILTTKKGDQVKVDKEEFIGFKDKEQWRGHGIQAESSPLIDPSIGEPRIIRTFMYALNPDFLKKNKGVKGIDRQELFNNHWKQIQLELWKDGLVADEAHDPKLTFKKKYYFIQITCKAKLGVVVADTPRNLQDYLK